MCLLGVLHAQILAHLYALHVCIGLHEEQIDLDI